MKIVKDKISYAVIITTVITWVAFYYFYSRSLINPIVSMPVFIVSLALLLLSFFVQSRKRVAFIAVDILLIIIWRYFSYNILY